jgi:predicted dehydrogenase
MQNFRVLHVGVGGRGRQWLGETLKHPEFTPVAFVEPSAQSVAKTREKFPQLDVPVFSSVNDALKSVKADVAIIAASSHARIANCTECINAGVHFIVEKPFALSLADGKRIVQLAAKKRVQIVAGQNYRYFGDLAAMAQQVRAGTLGKLGAGIFLRTRRRFGKGTYQQSMRHNYLWEMAVHDFDLMRFTLNLKPKRVVGWSWQAPWGDYKGETTVQALFEFERGVRANYFGAWGNTVEEYMWRIDGSDGALRTDGALKFASMAAGQWQPVEHIQTQGEWELMNELIAAIQSGKPAPTSGKDNLWTLAMMEAVVRATKSGRWTPIKV